MDEDLFSIRLAKLRELKNVSAREMSLSIGQNKNYINQIENGKTYPTMQVFFIICEYLMITPKDFFDEGNLCPEQINSLFKKLKTLNPVVLSHIEGIVDELIDSKTSK